jgi:hypothetical protein
MDGPLARALPTGHPLSPTNLTREEASAIVDALRRAALPIPWTPAASEQADVQLSAYHKLCKIAGAVP